MTPKLVMIRKRWEHMGLQSGSDQLCGYLARLLPSENYFINQVNVPTKGILQRIFERLKVLPKENLWAFQLSSVNGIKEIYTVGRAIATLKKYPDTILFLSCGEEQLTKQVKQLTIGNKRRIHVLLHQPPSWYESEPLFLNHLEGLGAIYVFSSRMKDYLNAIISTPVFVIKHGVDFDFFKPNNNADRDSKSIICVGNWYRDFDLLDDLWAKLIEYDNHLNLTLVAPVQALENEYFQKLLKKPNVVHKSALDSVELLKLYQRAVLHLLPLSDGVANNALVESLSTACPVLVTDTSSSAEYLPPGHFGLALKGNVNDHFLKAITLLENNKIRNQMALNQMIYAKDHLSWHLISMQIASNIASSVH